MWKKKVGCKKMTTCTVYIAITVENNSIWHHTEHFYHYVFTVLEDCFRKMFQITMSMFVRNWAQGLEVFFHGFLISTHSSFCMAASHAS